MTKERYIDEIMGLEFTTLGKGDTTRYKFGGFRIHTNPIVNEMRLYGTWYDVKVGNSSPEKNSEEDWTYIQSRLERGQWYFLVNETQRAYLEDLFGWLGMGIYNSNKHNLKLDIQRILQNGTYDWKERYWIKQAIKLKESK